MSVSNSSLKLLRSTFKLSSRRYASGDASQMAFTFAAPSQVLYNNANIRQVDVPSFSGSFGILPAHVATLAVLKPGVVTVYQEDGSTKKFFVSSGTVTVNDDSSVQVLAEEAVPIESLDLQAARDVLSKAQSDVISAGVDISKLAEGQIAVEVGEALVKAAEGQQ